MFLNWEIEFEISIDSIRLTVTKVVFEFEVPFGGRASAPGLTVTKVVFE